MAVYPLWVTLSHLTFCLYNNYIMYTQKVKCYFKKSNQYSGVRFAPHYLPVYFVSQSTYQTPSCFPTHG